MISRNPFSLEVMKSFPYLNNKILDMKLKNSWLAFEKMKKESLKERKEKLNYLS